MQPDNQTALPHPAGLARVWSLLADQASSTEPAPGRAECTCSRTLMTQPCFVACCTQSLVAFCCCLPRLFYRALLVHVVSHQSTPCTSSSSSSRWPPCACPRTAGKSGDPLHAGALPCCRFRCSSQVIYTLSATCSQSHSIAPLCHVCARRFSHHFRPHRFQGGACHVCGVSRDCAQMAMCALAVLRAWIDEMTWVATWGQVSVEWGAAVRLASITAVLWPVLGRKDGCSCVRIVYSSMLHNTVHVACALSVANLVSRCLVSPLSLRCVRVWSSCIRFPPPRCMKMT